jgi:hypothetical protein
VRVQYGLYLVFLFTFHEDWWGWGFGSSANDGVRSGKGELDNGKDGMQSGKAWCEFQAVGATSNTSFNRVRAQTTVGELYGWPISVALTHTRSPGCSSGAGSRRWL